MQHIEHDLLAEDALHVAFGEASGVSVFRAAGDGVYECAGERPMQIRFTYDRRVLTWAWHWGTGKDDVVERSRATCSRVDV